MGKTNFGNDLKRDTVHQSVERGYPVAEVSKRLGVSPHSLHNWMKKFSEPGQPNSGDEQSSEIRRLKNELLRVTDERDILRKATAYFAKDAK